MKSLLKTGIYAYNTKKYIIPKYALPVAAALTTHFIHNEQIELGINCAISITDYSIFLVEGYLSSLDSWRKTEAQYEEKTDPPEWNIRLYDIRLHILTIACILCVLSHNKELQISSDIILLFFNKYKKEMIIEDCYKLTITCLESLNT
jgi:SUMO ligase MMS21 Smc5/6 complex component